MSDIDMLKAIVDQHAVKAIPGGRFDSADEAVSNVLHLLYETPSSKDLWEPIYEAIKSAYVGSTEWNDADE